MRIALVTPYYLPSTRGNAVTVRRIEQQLQQLGCRVAVFSLETATAEAIAAAARGFAPDIVHAFHAVHCGRLAAVLAAENRTPYIITMTGTDMYLRDEDATAGLAALGDAAALVFFAPEVQQSFLRAHGELTVPTSVIPQGVVLPDSFGDEAAETAVCNFFLPAGVRAVKNLLFPFPPLAELQRRHPETRLVLAGGVIEPAYAARLLEAVAAHPFSSWLGEVAFAEMPQLYQAAHIVVNSSLAEGGMANSLLEGMAYGKPLLAAAVEGNRSLVRDGENGFLYDDAGDFLKKAELLLLDRELRRRMGAAGRAFVSRHCLPRQEAESYLQLYGACCRKR